MSNLRGVVLLAASTLIGLSGCDPVATQQTAVTEPAAHGDRPLDESKDRKMKVTIGKKTFTATLEDNSATAKLRGMLPLTLDMGELNGNEKFARLPAPLPTEDANSGTIHAGDLLLWSADTLVLFYDGLRTSYSYTRLGRIDDPAGLAAAVGAKGVKVTFELE